MDINIVEVESKVHLLAMSLSNTFFLSVNDNYHVRFHNSNVIEEWKTLDLLLDNLCQRTPTVIIQKDIDLLKSTLESYTFLISTYKKLNKIAMLSPKLKRYDLITFINNWCKQNSSANINAISAPLIESSIEAKIDTLVRKVNPESQFKTKKEKRQATVKAEIAKILLKN